MNDCHSDSRVEPAVRATLRGRMLAGVVVVLLFAGCQTPDLQPFAAASATVTTSIRQGGDLAISPLAHVSVWVDDEIVRPDAPDHPAAQLAAAWEPRRKACDAVLVYSAALAGIGDASTGRRANATALVDAVQQLASAIPGVNLGTSAVGNLLVTSISGVVEVKAWREMGAAVQGADPAIQIIADALRTDLEAMATLHEGFYKGKRLEASGTDLRKLVRLQERLRHQQDQRRTAVADGTATPDLRAELAQIDGVLAGVDRELDARHRELVRLESTIAEGRRFYSTAIAAIDAWAAAHADLVQVFAQKRPPNLALLVARAQELEAQIDEFRISQRNATSP